MAKYLLAEGGGINWMAIFALITFVIIFAVVIVMVFGRKKEAMDYMSELPLNDGSPSSEKPTDPDKQDEKL